MGPSANDFSNRRRPGRRGDGPGMGGPGRGPARGGPGGGQGRGPASGPGGGGEGSRGRGGRGLNDPRRPSASTFRRPGPRPEGQGAFEDRRWSRDRQERPSGEVWRRGGEGGERPQRPADDRPKWRVARRQEGPPARPIRPFRGPAAAPDTELPRGDSHAEAAPSELIWGRHAALAALESARPIHRVWCTAEMRFRPSFLQLLREAKASGVLVEEVTWARLGQISGGAVHQGIVLQPAAADTLDLPSLVEGCKKLGESPLLVAVDGLTDPQNLGAILRSAEALGVHGVVLPQRRNAGLTGSVAKVAAGALEHLPVARVVNLNRSLETLRQEGYRVVGLDPQGTVSLEDADLEGPLVVITGSEGQGLSLLTRRNCDQLVRIPLRGTTPSLNASVATALVLYEVARRGWMRGLRGTAKPPRLVRPQLATEPLGGEADSLSPLAERFPGVAEPYRRAPEPVADLPRPLPAGVPSATQEESPPAVAVTQPTPEDPHAGALAAEPLASADDAPATNGTLAMDDPLESDDTAAMGDAQSEDLASPDDGEPLFEAPAAAAEPAPEPSAEPARLETVPGPALAPVEWPVEPSPRPTFPGDIHL